MPRPRTRLNWHYDATREEFTTPIGRVITLTEIARRLYDDVTNTHDLAGDWSGWRMRGAVLIGPGGIRVRPEQLRAIANSTRPADGVLRTPTPSALDQEQPRPVDPSSIGSGRQAGPG